MGVVDTTLSTKTRLKWGQYASAFDIHTLVYSDMAVDRINIEHDHLEVLKECKVVGKETKN